MSQLESRGYFLCQTEPPHHEALQVGLGFGLSNLPSLSFVVGQTAEVFNCHFVKFFVGESGMQMRKPSFLNQECVLEHLVRHFKISWSFSYGRAQFCCHDGTANVVPGTGLEPAQLSPQDPKSCVSTNSTTRA